MYYKQVLIVPKSFDVSEGFGWTKGAFYTTITFVGPSLGFIKKINNDSLERLTYSFFDRRLVVEGADEKTFIERLDRIIFALMDFS